MVQIAPRVGVGCRSRAGLVVRPASWRRASTLELAEANAPESPKRFGCCWKNTSPAGWCSNWTRIGHLNSFLIGQLVRSTSAIGTQGGIMRLCGLSDVNRRVLDQCRLSGRLPCTTAQGAVMAVRPAPLPPAPVQPR